MAKTKARAFDAAIKRLEKPVDFCLCDDCLAKDTKGIIEKQRRELDNAIDVLEAAGKVEVVKWEKVIAAVANANYDALLRAIWEAQNGKDK